MTDSITSLPDESKTAIEIVSLWTSIPIYLVLSIKGCSFLEGLRRTLKTYSKGRLLRNESDKAVYSDVPSAEAPFFVLGVANSRCRRVMTGGSRVRWPAELHVVCVRRECSSCASDCRRLRPN